MTDTFKAEVKSGKDAKVTCGTETVFQSAGPEAALYCFRVANALNQTLHDALFHSGQFKE